MLWLFFFSFLVNGNAQVWMKVLRRLRESYPFSLFLFVIVIDVLSGLAYEQKNVKF